MDKKLSVWQGLLIASIITPICKHLTYPWNLVVTIFATFGIFIWLIKERKNHNKFNFYGVFFILIGSILVVMMMMGNLNGISLFTQIIASLGMIFLGVVLIGVGNHIANPEKVSKKTIYIAIAFFSSILGIYWILLNL